MSVVVFLFHLHSSTYLGLLETCLLNILNEKITLKKQNRLTCERVCVCEHLGFKENRTEFYNDVFSVVFFYFLFINKNYTIIYF